MLKAMPDARSSNPKSFWAKLKGAPIVSILLVLGFVGLYVAMLNSL